MKTLKALFVFLFILFYSQAIFPQTGYLDTTFDDDGIVTSQFQLTNSLSLQNGFSAIQTDGKIVIVGVEIFPNSTQDVIKVIRYNTNGSLDTSFGNNGASLLSIGFFENIKDIKIQFDGKILISGDRFFGSSTDLFVIRLNPDGILDNSFNSSGGVTINVSGNSNELGGRIAVQPDGKIVVIGRTDFASNPPTDNIAIIRLNPNGSLDTNFSTNGILIPQLNSETSAQAVGLQSDNKIIVSGYYDNGSNLDLISMRLNTNGTIDSSYGTDGYFITPIGDDDEYVGDLEILPDNKILLTGTVINTDRDIFITRFTANGEFDSSFVNNGIIIKSISANSNDYGIDLAKINNGDFGLLGRSGGEVVVFKFKSDGSPDISFGLNGIASERIVNNYSTFPSSLSFQSGGKPVASGFTFNNSSAPSFYFVARFLAENSNASHPPKFDFDGDNKTDISIFRPAPGQWWYLRSSDNDNRAFQFGQGSDRLVPADFTGDGKTDIAFWRESTGEWFVLRSEDNSFYSFPFGTNGDIPIPADFDGDGKADPAIYRPSNSTWFILNSGGGTTIQQFGLTGDAPIPNDFDGDGKADLAVFRSSESQWFYQKSTDLVVKGFQFGSSGDKAVPADFTGDGKADIAFWRPGSGEWFILRSEDNSFFAFPFGTNGDIPTPGDYDGDGTAVAAVFRPSNNIWYLQQSTSGFTAVQFGIENDIPIPSAYIP